MLNVTFAEDETFAQLPVKGDSATLGVHSLFDTDRDFDVDLDDFKTFLDCMGGPRALRPPTCGGQLDEVLGDIDLKAYSAFELAIEPLP